MKIKFVAYKRNEQNDGGWIVSSRNLRFLQNVFGEENVDEYYFPLPNLKSIGSLVAFIVSFSQFKAEIRKEGADIVWFDTTALGEVVRWVSKMNIENVVFAHNIEMLLYKQRHSFEQTLFSYIKYKYVKKNEKLCFHFAGNVITLNQRDKEDLFSLYGKETNAILPISCPSQKCNSVTNSSQPYCLFVGSDFFPNVHGIGWFIENVAKHLNKEVWIVGSCCHSLNDLNNIPPNVHLKGYISDLNECYINACCVIAPIFMGSGMKTKTIEAMSYGKSIFGTEEAFVGISGDFAQMGGKCNTADEFIYIINRHKNEVFNPYVADLFANCYSDEVVSSVFQKIFESIRKKTH